MGALALTSQCAWLPRALDRRAPPGTIAASKPTSASATASASASHLAASHRLSCRDGRGQAVLSHRAVRFAARHARPRRCARGVVTRSELSALTGEKGLPLPITQPSVNMWNASRPLRKSTPEEESCDATQESCTIARIVKTYDSTCAACNGAGSIMTRSFTSSRFRKKRSTLCRCMMCGGAGYVRVCTTRVAPDFGKDDSLPAAYTPAQREGPSTPTLTVK
mmetsp:Transcript_32343/g.81412  ORF Transcript_32343/g.81412 Transcript_32343/m.81412 type:complete len:222 (-) Transcript_32343:146-811(-)